MKRDIFIGGAWPYANYLLHIGHLAALLPGDLIARYYRLNGDNVIYVSGSDSHGTPITQRAKIENKTPEEIASYYHKEFVKTFEKMNFSYDEYSDTSTEYHIKVVQDYFLTMYENGYLYELEAPEVYCEACNEYLSDREIVGTCPHCGGVSTGDQCDECLTSLNNNELLDKHCKNCHSITTMKNNKHLYFKLTAFANELQKLIDNNSDRWRKNALGEAQKYLDMGLVDRAATRQIDWGVKVPIPGYENKRIYVWFEAVFGYLSMAKLVAERIGIDFDEYFSNDNKKLRTYYAHGKDNITFHATIFPALELALKKNYRLPDYIISSAYLTLNEEKMSKSKGNLITVNELLEKFESDTIRFYFTLNGPETRDTSCSIEDIVKTHNKFLVGVLGNFINRNLSFVLKKFEGEIIYSEIDEYIKKRTISVYDEVGILIEKGEFKSALNLVLDYISSGNKYYDEKQPWILAKENIEEFNKVTYTCVYMMANIANLINPFIPDTSIRIIKLLKLDDPKWKHIELKENIKLDEISLLFNKID